MIRFTSLTFAAITSMTLWTSSAAAQGYRHAIFRLPKPIDENSVANGMDERGNVAGFLLDVNANLPPVLWQQASGPIYLPTFGGLHGFANDINAAGDVVGWATFAGGGIYDERAALWRDGQTIELGTLGGEDSEALAINDLGEIVGWSEKQLENGRFPFIWRGGVMEQLPDLGIGGRGWANGLNNAGLVIGHFAGRAMLWQNQQPPLDLGTLRPDGLGESVAYDINDGGYIVGGADIDSLKTNAFVWYDGTMHDIGRLPNRKAA